MNLDMMVVGIKSITDEMMELVLVPIIAKNKKLTIGDISSDPDRDAKELVNLFMQEKQYRTLMYFTREWCSNHNVTMFMHINLDITIGELSRHRVGK